MYHKYVVALLFSCSESRQGIDPCVVLPTDVFQCYPLETGDEVGDRVVVSLQQRLFRFELPLYLADHQLGVFLHVTSQVSMSYAKYKTSRMASYSVWLLVALNSNLSACSRMWLLGPLRTTPTPHAILLEDPSSYTVHAAESSC